MCVLAFAWRDRVDYPVVIAGNRDEFHERPTTPAHWWTDHPDVLAGQDLMGGGTWMGLSRSGRFAVVTNIRERAGAGPSEPPSRGSLVTDFLASPLDPTAWGATVRPDAYSGFNLIYGDLDGAHYLSNRDPAPREFAPGVYGLSNHLLDTPWPKLVKTRERIAGCLHSETVQVADMFEVLSDTGLAGEDELPETGLPVQWERRLSSVFIVGEDYGTRASTVMMIGADGVAYFEERGFGRAGRPLDVRRFEFSIERAE